MRPCPTLLAILFIVSATTRAQVVPAATGPAGLPVSGTLHYDLRYSQTAQFYGGPGGDVQRSVASGEVAYANASATHPLTLTYSGGDMWNITGTSEGTGVFQHLLVSQGILRHAWTFSLSDDVSYMPQAPTTGFSGIPGVGILPVLPVVPVQPILTLNTRSVNNTASPNFTHRLDHTTNLSIGGSYNTLRFPDGNGLDIDTLQAGPQITRRLNALNSISGQYSFSRISYPGYTSFTMETQSALFGSQRTWNRHLNTNVAAGPQWIQSSDSALIPSSIDFTVKASATYGTKSTSAMLSYSRAVTGGSGVPSQFGTHNDDVNASFTQQLGRNLTISATSAYMRTQGLQLGLPQIGVINAEYGGVAATRRLSRYIIVFANYTATHQSSSSVLPANAINGLSQVVSFGVGYSPRETHFRK
ncbi:MAG: hypothetical protein WCA89_03565 [Terracidiphilus sp.]|jgi:hypothetical protein